MMTDQCIDRLSLNKTHNDVWLCRCGAAHDFDKIFGYNIAFNC